ncbi:hypothetical protein B0T16DRAFT_454774 [Cercophora newfieldiana]|uniref:AAA+ ATPase domain-containing protein n=1 Tax=Cercophora newfieldiana TaxID=92897 RepID=A0AA39YHH0_9PEZI|nr:hypothetical protein B0T16DRAFT_454774 [Cercophora newfieldiana]
MGSSKTPNAAASDAKTVPIPIREGGKDATSPDDDSVSQLEFTDDLDADFKPGMMSAISELYRDDSDCDWDEWTPEDIDRGHSAEWDKHALVICRQRKGFKGALFFRSLKIQSPLLLGTKLKELVHDAPFHEYYYRWHLFEKAYRDSQETDDETKHHMDLLYPVISKEILPHIKAVEDYTKNGVINFDYVWAIFPPGTCVYTKTDEHHRMYEVTGCSYLNDAAGQPYLNLDCRYIDCDGTSFGYIAEALYIELFHGVKKIHELDVVPMHLHPDKESMLDRLHARGEKFEAHLGYKYVNYTGFYTAPQAQRKRREADKNRFIVDRKMFDIYYNGYETSLEDLSPKSQDKDDSNDATEEVLSVAYRATKSAYREFQKVLERYDSKNSSTNASTVTLTPKQRMLCTPILKGYCLTSKQWCEFPVDGVSEIEFNEDAFDRLVLAQGYKEIIHAFVGEQLSREDGGFDDIIKGKGQGFIMLLSGEPGVGKTLTAESVAEKMHRPLYSIGAGELGDSTSTIETELEKVLELAAKWKAILLLDECDIFLEARTTADIERNRLVSIFLRQLEYFRGFMFLTTNRVTAFDAAFESRIHLTINYEPLDFNSRRYVWETFLRSAPGGAPGSDACMLSEDDFKALAEHKLNGRQIKNIVKTAWLLAKQSKKPLTLENLQTVLKVKSGAAIFGKEG